MQIQEEKGNFYRPKWQLKAKGQPHPARRWCHTATPYGASLFIMGGRLSDNAKVKEYIYKINCQTFECEQIQLSQNIMLRESHSCSLINDSIYVLFGISKSSNVLKDCSQLKIGQNSLIYHKKQQKSQIEPRQSHMSVVLKNRFILIYGGVDSNEKLIDDFYIYDIEQQTWRKIQKIDGKVEGKVGGSLIIIKNQIYLFGGQITDQNQYSNQIYKIQIKNYQHNTKQQQPQIIIHKLNVYGNKPLPRSQFAFSAFKDRFLIILGGQGMIKQKSQSPTLLADVWAFDTEKLIWEEIVPENANIFKPRSSFTATVYKQSLIVFGGLVGLKDFRSTDQLFVLNLNTEVQKRPTCNLCKSSYKVFPKEEIIIQKPKAKFHPSNFNTGFSTIFSISQQIPDPFTAIGTLLHSLNPFNVKECSIKVYQQSLLFKLKNIEINQVQWNKILLNYQFNLLIQESDPRLKSALKLQIRENYVNYLSYNLKNCGFRLGNEILISWINSNTNQLELCLLNKFGIYHTSNISSLSQNTKSISNSAPSHTSIIFQHLKQNNISMKQIFQNPFTITIASLKQLKINNIFTKQITFSKQKNDIVHYTVQKDKKNNKISYKQKQLKHYLNLCFAQKLQFEIYILNGNGNSMTNNQNKFQFHRQFQVDKWPQQNIYPQLFENIFTYSSQKYARLALIYQNNKLMHITPLNSQQSTHLTVYQFHLTNTILPNLTFSDVQPTQELIDAVKNFIRSLNDFQSRDLKRNKPVQMEIVDKQLMKGQSNLKKAVKTNESQSGECEMQIQGGCQQQGQV